MPLPESTIFICFLRFLGVFLATSLILMLCKKTRSTKLDSDSTRRETQRDAEIESRLLELLEEMSDSKKRKKKKKHKKRKKSKEKRQRKDKTSRKEEGPEDAPRKIPLNEKEMKIAKGLKVASGDYPTMDNVKSDWDPE